MDINLKKFWEMVKAREACNPWGPRVGQDLVTEQQNVLQVFSSYKKVSAM